MGDKPVIRNMMTIIKNKEEMGEAPKLKNVDQRPTKGYITHNDIIRLSKL